MIVAYEGAMLGAVVGTLIGVFLEMRLPRIRTIAVYDPRIREGKILLCAAVEPGDEARRAMDALSAAGGIDVRTEEGTI